MSKDAIRVASLVVVLIVLFIIGLACISGANAWGNKTWWDTTYSFERAIIQLPNDLCIEGEVQEWLDFEDSDMIQVKIDNKVYLTHSSNVVLISE